MGLSELGDTTTLKAVGHPWRQCRRQPATHGGNAGGGQRHMEPRREIVKGRKGTVGAVVAHRQCGQSPGHCHAEEWVSCGLHVEIWALAPAACLEGRTGGGTGAGWLEG